MTPHTLHFSPDAPPALAAPGPAPALPFGPLKRFGVFGGSFNPVHLGHLSIAQQVLNRLKLEKVVLMPAWVSPFKKDDLEMASPEDRLELCKLATLGLRGLAVSSLELDRGGVSYTVETAKTLRDAYGPHAEIYFLIGSDSLDKFAKWREVRTLLELVRFAIADRREAPLSEEVWTRLRDELGPENEARLRAGVVPVERVDMSSTKIRQWLRSEDRLATYLRKDVEAYIRKNGLYGAKPEQSAKK